MMSSIQKFEHWCDLFIISKETVTRFAAVIQNPLLVGAIFSQNHRPINS
jgi:hypothetical protein